MFNITDKISKNKSFTGITADDNINADEAEVRRLNDSQEARLKAIDDYLSGASTSSVKSKTRMSSKSMSKHHRLLAHEGELRSSSSLLFPGNDGKSGENTDNANVDGSNRMSTSMMLRLMGDTKYDDKENSFDSSNVHTQDEDEVQTQEMIGLWQKAKHHLRSLQASKKELIAEHKHTVEQMQLRHQNELTELRKQMEHMRAEQNADRIKQNNFLLSSQQDCEQWKEKSHTLQHQLKVCRDEFTSSMKDKAILAGQVRELQANVHEKVDALECEMKRKLERKVAEKKDQEEYLNQLHSEQQRRWQVKFDEQQREIASLKGELNHSFSVKEERIHQAHKETAKLADQCREGKLLSETLRGELLQLKHQLKEAGKTQDLLTNEAQLKTKQIKILEGQLEDLSNELSKTKASAGAAAIDQKIMEKQEDEIARLMRQYTHHQQMILTLRQSNADAAKEQAAVQAESSQQTTTIKRLMKAVKDGNREVNKLQKKLLKSKREYDTASVNIKTENQQLEEDVSKKKRHCEKLTKKAKEYKQEVTVLAEQFRVQEQLIASQLQQNKYTQLQMEKNKAQEESYRQQIRELANENKQHQHTIVELGRMVENLKCRKCIILNKEMVRLRKSHEQELRLMTTALTKKGCAAKYCSQTSGAHQHAPHTHHHQRTYDIPSAPAPRASMHAQEERERWKSSGPCTNVDTAKAKSAGTYHNVHRDRKYAY